MKRLFVVLGSIGVLLAYAASGATAQSTTINPSGSYAVATVDEEGTPLSGTMTVQASGAGYTGQFVAASGDTIKMLQVTTNGQHMMAVFETGNGMAMTWLQRQPDGTFTGSWHPLGPGINVKATKKTDR